MLHLKKESVCVSEILSVYVYILRIGGSKVLYIIIKVFMIFKKNSKNYKCYEDDDEIMYECLKMYVR